MPTPEEQALEIIDQKLTSVGWVVQDFKQLNLGAGTGAAVHEFMSCRLRALRRSPGGCHHRSQEGRH